MEALLRALDAHYSSNENRTDVQSEHSLLHTQLMSTNAQYAEAFRVLKECQRVEHFLFSQGKKRGAEEDTEPETSGSGSTPTKRARTTEAEKLPEEVEAEAKAAELGKLLNVLAEPIILETFIYEGDVSPALLSNLQKLGLKPLPNKKFSVSELIVEFKNGTNGAYLWQNMCKRMIPLVTELPYDIRLYNNPERYPQWFLTDTERPYYGVTKVFNYKRAWYLLWARVWYWKLHTKISFFKATLNFVPQELDLERQLIESSTSVVPYAYDYDKGPNAITNKLPYDLKTIKERSLVEKNGQESANVTIFSVQNRVRVPTYQGNPRFRGFASRVVQSSIEHFYLDARVFIESETNTKYRRSYFDWSLKFDKKGRVFRVRAIATRYPQISTRERNRQPLNVITLDLDESSQSKILLDKIDKISFFRKIRLALDWSKLTLVVCEAIHEECRRKDVFTQGNTIYGERFNTASEDDKSPPDRPLQEPHPRRR